MEKIPLDIIALTQSVTPSNNFAVILGEIEGERRLPVVIGNFEAQAIAVAFEGMEPNRPLTHDLFLNTLNAFDIELEEVIINNLLDGIFYALLICTHHGQRIEIDSRTSDAIALAVRFNAPVYTYEFILDTAGIEMEGFEGASEPVDNDEPPRRQPRNRRRRLSDMEQDDLQDMLEKVISEEDYEKAAQIRDELNRRQAN